MFQQKIKYTDSLAIIILNYCSANDVIKNVKNLLSFNKTFHIIVVDNSSPDGSFQKIRDFFENTACVDILQTGSNLGYAFGNNFGIRYAMERYGVKTVAIMNPDVVIPSMEVIEKVCTLLYSDEKCIFAGGRPLNHYCNDEPMPMAWDIPSASGVVLNSSLFIGSGDMKHQKRFTRIRPNVYRCECVAGCFFVAKSALFKKIKYFDEGTFLYNEENILGIRAHDAGYYCLVDTSLNYYHNHYKRREYIPLKKKLHSINTGLDSRIYLARTYYSRLIIPFLYFMHGLNKIFLLFAWCKHRFINPEDK